MAYSKCGLTSAQYRVHSYAQVIRFSASIYLPPLRIDEDQEGLLLVYDDFLLNLNEDPIYETN